MWLLFFLQCRSLAQICLARPGYHGRPVNLGVGGAGKSKCFQNKLETRNQEWGHWGNKKLRSPGEGHRVCDREVSK